MIENNTNETMHLVAVYGSLLTGLHNHGVMNSARGVLLGEDLTSNDFQMVSLGSFPGLYQVEEGCGTSIKIEVYEVPQSGLKGPLDSLEGYYEDDEDSSMYIRRKIKTKYGEAWIYIFNSSYYRNDEVVESGDWRRYLSE